MLATAWLQRGSHELIEVEIGMLSWPHQRGANSTDRHKEMHQVMIKVRSLHCLVQWTARQLIVKGTYENLACSQSAYYGRQVLFLCSGPRKVAQFKIRHVAGTTTHSLHLGRITCIFGTTQIDLVRAAWCRQGPCLHSWTWSYSKLVKLHND